MGNQITTLYKWWNPQNTAAQSCSCNKQELATYSLLLRRLHVDATASATLTSHGIPAYFLHRYYDKDNCLDQSFISLASCEKCMTEGDRKHFRYSAIGFSIYPYKAFEPVRKACWG